MAITNFRQAVNDHFKLPETATATDRKNALRSLFPQELSIFCQQQRDPETAYTIVRDFIAPELSDVVFDGYDQRAYWAGEAVTGRDTAAHVYESLQLYFEALYPVSFAQLSASDLWCNDRLWYVTFDGAIVGKGIDRYSAALCLYDHRSGLQQDGLIGLLFDQELEAVHG